jgi:predicted Zn-dependent protease
MKDSSYLGTGTSANRVVIPGSVGNSGTELDGFLIPMKFAASTRETDADARGIQYLQKAGYDPMALVTFLQKMRPKEESDVDRLLAMFQTHPPTAERIRLAQERISNAGPAHPNADTVAEFMKIKAILQTRTTD